MKFVSGVVKVLALALLTSPGCDAENHLRGGNRDLQNNGGRLTCIRITSPDGSSRTVFPCTTPAPVSAALGVSDSADDNSVDSDSDEGSLMTPTAMAGTAGPNNIVQTATAAGSFTSLVYLLEDTGLDATLLGPGPFTVFAPRDGALPTGLALETFEETTPLPTIRSILAYHVVPGIIRSTDLVDGATVTTVQGSSITVNLTEGVKINQANVVQADIEASNGIIHVIDAVLTPP